MSEHATFPDLTLFEQLSEMMPEDASPRDVVERLSWLVREAVPCDSAVIFRALENRFEGTVVRASNAEELSRWERSPLLTETWTAGQFVERKVPPNARFSKLESAVLLVPIRNYGILYLGRKTGIRFSRIEIAAALNLCQQTYFALKWAKLRMQKEHDQQVKELESRLFLIQDILTRVSSSVEIVTALMGESLPTEMLQKAGDALSELAEFEAWLIEVDEKDTRPLRLEGGPLGSELDPECLKRLRADFPHRKAMQLLNLERTSYGTPAPDIRSALICPLLADGEMIGAVFLFSKRRFFTLQEQKMITSFTLAVSSLYWILRLHERLKFAQAKLVQSSKMAAVGQLAAGVAHELNTPLSAITLGLQGATRIISRKPERAKERLETVLGSCADLKNIISRLLTYSHAKAYDDEEPNLNEVITAALDLVGTHARRADITIETDLDANEPPFVRAKANEIQQVVINLVNNAMDAILEGNVDKREILIKTRTGPKIVALVISDTGCGMNEETRRRLFEPFYTTKDIGKGTGLGMSIAREIIESYGGEVEVRSSVGRGTRILIKFPRGGL